MVSAKGSEVDTRSFRLSDLFARELRSDEKLRKMFDTVPIREVREACLMRMKRLESREAVGWAIDRIKIFLNIPTADSLGEQGVVEDFETVFLLVHSIVYASEQCQEEVFAIMLEVLERALHPKQGDARMSVLVVEKATVIMCGHLKQWPKHYNEQARRLLHDMLDNGTGMPWHGIATGQGDDYYRRVQRLLLIVEVVGDTSFLPVAKSFVLPLGNSAIFESLGYHLEYLSVSREQIVVDALARQVVAFLEHLKEQSQP